MKVDIFKNQEIILDDTQNKIPKIDYEQNIKPDRSLLDYYLADERAKTVVSSFLYTRSGTSQDLLNVKPLNYCKMAENNYPFDENKLDKEDIWLTEDENGRKMTPYMRYNKDKVNYLVHYYLERGGDMRMYPFENDSDETRTAYKHLAEFYA